MKGILVSRLSLLLMAFFLLFGSPLYASTASRTYEARGSYAVVVSQETYGQPAWQEVVQALRKKHDGTLFLYSGRISLIPYLVVCHLISTVYRVKGGIDTALKKVYGKQF